MRILAVNGSPRKGGSTDGMITEILKRSAGKETTIDYRHLIDLEFSDCRGCNHCKEEGHCRIEDGMQTLYTSIEEADMVIAASPIYMGAETGMMKSFLDRLYAFLAPSENGFSSRLPPGKRAILFFTCGNPDGNVVYYSVIARCSRIFKLHLGFEDVHTYIVPGISTGVNILEYHVASQIIDAITALITGNEPPEIQGPFSDEEDL